MLDVARGLAARGLDVDLVLVRAKGPYLDAIPSGVRIVDLDAPRALASIPGLRRYLRKEAPRVLLATLSHASVAARVATWLVRVDVPLVIRRASHFTMEFANSGFKRRLVLLLEKAILPTAAAVVVNSTDSRIDLRRHLGFMAAVEQINNPVVWPEHAAMASMPIDGGWSEDPDETVVLSVGRLVPSKDHATLVRAFARVVATRPVRLVVLGEGSERTRLTALAASLGIGQAVEFVGFRSNPFAYMSKAGVFVLSSRYEGSPNVLIQAMACGTPVISTDCPGGPREILEDGKWGALVPVGDVDSLNAAIEHALDKPGDRQALKARASCFDAESSINAYLDLIVRVARVGEVGD